MNLCASAARSSHTRSCIALKQKSPRHRDKQIRGPNVPFGKLPFANHDLASPSTFKEGLGCPYARRLAPTEIEMRAFRVVPIFALLCFPASAHEFPASAHGPDMSVGHGVICDTLKQVEHFAALRSDGKEAEEALQTVNHYVTGPGACVQRLVKFTGGERVARLSINGKPASVLEITVHAFSNGGAWNDVSETVQYILVPEKGLIA